ncbi:MAG: hypothetical protein GYB65_08495 [Chloroflexi bacterium]|nr:hypothetical protein [Chloroflexota bacterium]
MVNFLATVTVISIGLVMIIGLLSDQDTVPGIMAAFLLSLVTVIAAVAVVVGVLNLIAVHLGRFTRAERGWPYSIVVLVVAIGVIVLRILDRADIWTGDLEGERISARLFEAVQVSIESALAALLLFFLAFAAFRLMRRQVTVWNVLFSVTVVVVLLGSDPLNLLSDTRDWLVEVPVNAGTRGLLIGVGLGTVTAGVRVLLGQDRSYRD